MTQRKTTKRALFASVLSLLVCVSMLIGSTFAWFTDTASTGVNSIVSGTLDVDLEMLVDGDWVDAEGETLGFVDKDGKVLTDILWEPGCSYLLQPFKIVNNGNLALKFDVVVSGFVGDTKLAEAIEYGLMLGPVDNLGFVAMGDLNEFDSLFDGIKGSVLKPGESTDTSGDGVTLHMKETAGNEYQTLTLSGMSIKIIATQATVESDSYDDQYDKNATYPIVTKPQLDEALADPALKNVTVAGGIYNDTVNIPTGKTMTTDNGTFVPENKYASAVDVESGGHIVLNGGTYMSSGQQIINSQSNDSTVTINSGTYKGTCLIWNGGSSKVVINGGEFDLWCLTVVDTDTTSTLTINGGNFELDSVAGNSYNGFTAGTSAPLVINGGTFNQNPTNWVGEGHNVVDNGNGTWTVK